MMERSSRWRLPEIAIALLALASSGVGILNQFAYDDRYVVETNALVHSLHSWWRGFAMSYWGAEWGGDGYRPITILSFRAEWAIGHGAPWAFHAANILLYVIASLLVFALARKLLPLPAAWLTAALFAVHPVHVEAVANVVGQSELLAAIAFLGATVLYLHDRQRGVLRPLSAVVIALLYALGCFAKEHAITLPAILIAAELTIVQDTIRPRERIRRLRPFYLGMIAIALIFIGARSAVLADHSFGGFAPFTPFRTLHISARDRILTAVGVVPDWMRLLLWPARLSSDYGPPDIDIAQGLSINQLPGLLLLAGIVAFAVVLRKRQRVISFGIWFAVLTLLPSSNFILPAGIVIAERTLFLPSLGAMLVVGEIVLLIWDAVRVRAADSMVASATVVAALGAILVLGVARSASRTKVWHDNDTLFRQTVIDVPLAYHAHYMLGQWEFELKRQRAGELEARKALRLFPYDPHMTFGLAERYSSVGMCNPAVPLYRWSRGLNPGTPHTVTFASCLLEVGEYDSAKTEALEVIRSGGNLTMARRVIFLADSAKAASARHPGNGASPTVAAKSPGKPPGVHAKGGSGTAFRTNDRLGK
jgi:protein O-mannosyl-transferase